MRSSREVDEHVSLHSHFSETPTPSPPIFALVSARLDYVNSILYGTSTKQKTRLQRVQNALARVVVPNRPPSSSLHLLKQLHWLPVEWCIKFKIEISILLYRGTPKGPPKLDAEIFMPLYGHIK